jgi:YD repeat-containing protein
MDTATSETTLFSYDALGSLREVVLPGGTTIDYVVDGLGRRVGKKVGGALMKGWLYGDALRPIAELDGAGAVVARFV